MKGYPTSFAGMFRSTTDGAPPVDRVEIPLIQRDYAQGRRSESVDSIRRDFLDVLVAAITGGDSVDLDFVYGDIEDGTLRPLDGQQRLTTLFLLHWYLAARTGRLAVVDWLRFTYATRPSAELFCRELVRPEHQPAPDLTTPSAWITDQAWYLFSWEHDPSVQAMLVMLDEIHARLGDTAVDLDAAWSRLTDLDRPAVSFQFLPIDDMPSGEELYIKMNSRGKPLTEFETFKARFERILEAALPRERFDEIVHKLDGAWADVLWPYHGGDFVIDDEFLRYLDFIVEVCEWRSGGTTPGTLLDRAERVFTGDGPHTARNLDFLFHAFDTWAGVDIDAVFAEHFVGVTAGPSPGGDAVVLFETTDVNLFAGCCRAYGQRHGQARVFSLAESLLLFAVLLDRENPTGDIHGRLRILRNLTDSAREVRDNRMVDLVDSVERLIRHGTLDGLKGFNAERIRDEERKRAFVAAHPEQRPVLQALEDHPLLRGRLFAFDLDPARLGTRAEAFGRAFRPENWPTLTAAMLAEDDYGYPLGDRAVQLGTGDKHQELRWREVLTRRGREENGGLPAALNAVLDAVAAGPGDPESTLEGMAAEFSRRQLAEGRLDWRYYLVTYPDMREGSTGVYYGEHLRPTGRWGYSMCMLRTSVITGGARYRDPYLLAVWRNGRVEEAVYDPWFVGYEDEPRWLRLKESETGIRCVTAGFELQQPADPGMAEVFHRVCEAHGATADLLPINQVDQDAEPIDTEDRIQKCAAFLRDLVTAGL